mmetsp:Transcript_64276/g.139879  ORF Transcript_64276/g.139879 Transcript_64276/m.139879 type:complete len:219 (-) Transcript_64276:120-776(-)
MEAHSQAFGPTCSRLRSMPTPPRKSKERRMKTTQWPSSVSTSRHARGIADAVVVERSSLATSVCTSMKASSGRRQHRAQAAANVAGNQASTARARSSTLPATTLSRKPGTASLHAAPRSSANATSATTRWVSLATKPELHQYSCTLGCSTQRFRASLKHAAEVSSCGERSPPPRGSSSKFRCATVRATSASRPSASQTWRSRHSLESDSRTRFLITSA